MALNTDSDTPTTALSAGQGQEEEQQQTEQMTNQQPDDVSGQAPITSQPVKTEHEDPPTDTETTPALESSVHMNGVAKDNLSVIDEKMETSKVLSMCFFVSFVACNLTIYQTQFSHILTICHHPTNSFFLNNSSSCHFFILTR